MPFNIEQTKESYRHQGAEIRTCDHKDYGDELPQIELPPDLSTTARFRGIKQESFVTRLTTEDTAHEGDEIYPRYLIRGIDRFVKKADLEPTQLSFGAAFITDRYVYSYTDAHSLSFILERRGRMQEWYTSLHLTEDYTSLFMHGFTVGEDDPDMQRWLIQGDKYLLSTLAEFSDEEITRVYNNALHAERENKFIDFASAFARKLFTECYRRITGHIDGTFVVDEQLINGTCPIQVVDLLDYTDKATPDETAQTKNLPIVCFVRDRDNLLETANTLAKDMCRSFRRHQQRTKVIPFTPHKKTQKSKKPKAEKLATKNSTTMAATDKTSGVKPSRAKLAANEIQAAIRHYPLDETIQALLDYMDSIEDHESDAYKNFNTLFLALNELNVKYCLERQETEMLANYAQQMTKVLLAEYPPKSKISTPSIDITESDEKAKKHIQTIDRIIAEFKKSIDDFEVEHEKDIAKRNRKKAILADIIETTLSVWGHSITSFTSFDDGGKPNRWLTETSQEKPIHKNIGEQTPFLSAGYSLFSLLAVENYVNDNKYFVSYTSTVDATTEDSPKISRTEVSIPELTKFFDNELKPHIDGLFRSTLARQFFNPHRKTNTEVVNTSIKTLIETIIDIKIIAILLSDPEHLALDALSNTREYKLKFPTKDLGHLPTIQRNIMATLEANGETPREALLSLYEQNIEKLTKIHKDINKTKFYFDEIAWTYFYALLIVSTAVVLSAFLSGLIAAGIFFAAGLNPVTLLCIVIGGASFGTLVGSHFGFFKSMRMAENVLGDDALDKRIDHTLYKAYDLVHETNDMIDETTSSEEDSTSANDEDDVTRPLTFDG